MCNYVCQISNSVELCLSATSQKQGIKSQLQAISLLIHSSGLPIRAVIIYYSGNRPIIVIINREITLLITFHCNQVFFFKLSTQVKS